MARSWKSGEHPHGLCWVNYERRMCYINIPKCASTTVKNTLIPVGFVESNFDENDFDDYLVFAVVREPMSRFVSGLSQYNRDTRAAYTSHEAVGILQAGEDTTFGGVYLRPQVWFLRGIHLDRVIRCDYLEEDMIPLSIIITARDNKTVPHSFHLTEQYSLTPEHIEQLRKFYAEDFAVYAMMHRVLETAPIQLRESCEQAR